MLEIKWGKEEGEIKKKMQMNFLHKKLLPSRSIPSNNNNDEPTMSRAHVQRMSRKKKSTTSNFRLPANLYACNPTYPNTQSHTEPHRAAQHDRDTKTDATTNESLTTYKQTDRQTDSPTKHPPSTTRTKSQCALCLYCRFLYICFRIVSFFFLYFFVTSTRLNISKQPRRK